MNTIEEKCCEKCRKLYEVWFTDNELWNRLAGDYHFLCPTCFSNLEKHTWYLTVRDERSEESAVQAERTRIIKALEGLKRPMHSGLDSVTFHQNDGFNTGIRQAIEAVGESAEKGDE